MDLHLHTLTLERGTRGDKLLAIEDLVEVGGVRAGGLLARALAHEKDAEVAVALARGLGELGLKRSLPALEKSLNSDLALADSGQSRDTFARAVVDALAVYASQSSLPALVRYFDNPRADRNVLLPTAHLIASLGETGEFHVLRRALDLHSTLWACAIQALDAPRYRVHASAVAALLPEANAHQALLVIRTLGAMAAREQAPAVRACLTRGVIQDPLEIRQAEGVLEMLERATGTRTRTAQPTPRP